MDDSSSDASKGESSHLSNDCQSVIGNIITEKMVIEEKKLEERATKEEADLKNQIINEDKQLLEEQCYKRLNLLLSRSSIYAQFMADKLKRDNLKDAKKQLKLEKQKEQLKTDSSKHSKKRKDKTVDIPQKKIQRCKMTIVDVFKKENEKCEDKIDENTEILNTSTVVAPDELNSKHPKLLTGAVMYPYQIEGFEWLKVLFENGVNGILADEMGLGKTIQCIAFICYLIEMGVSGPFLVLGPLSTVPNWYSEVQRFAPSVPAIVYHGDSNERKELRKQFLKKVQTKDICSFPIVLTSYQIALVDEKFLRKFDWKLMVIDEAHRIKNFQCRLVTSLKCFKVSHRLLLTGTPLQNNLPELWSLLNFILPEIFDDLKVFESWFDISRLSVKDGTSEIVAKEQEKQLISTIHQILTPFLLRRTKTEVMLSLPKKKEVVVYAPFTKLQQEYYKAVLNRTIEEYVGSDRGHYFEVKEIDINSSRPKRAKISTISYVLKDLDDENFEDNPLESFEDNPLENCENIPLESNVSVSTDNSTTDNNDILADITINTRNTSMLLRKICLHPYLVAYPLLVSEVYKIDEDLIKSSGKLLVLDMLLAELKQRGHKVLVFSQFVVMLEILEDYCRYRNYSYKLICGSTKLEDRGKQIKEFNESPESFLFLISTKAGGLGINLAQADTVIIYDSDWNPQGDLQAQDRCHRIGQTKPVVVYRLIVPNTVDEEILNRATAKRKLEKVIIKEGRFNAKGSFKRMSLEELQELLRACEYNGYVKTNDNNILSSTELERLLDRSDLM